MRRFALMSAALGVGLLLLSSLSWGETNVERPIQQTTITPTTFSYLPLVAGHVHKGVHSLNHSHAEPRIVNGELYSTNRAYVDATATTAARFTDARPSVHHGQRFHEAAGLNTCAASDASVGNAHVNAMHL